MILCSQAQADSDITLTRNDGVYQLTISKFDHRAFDDVSLLLELLVEMTQMGYRIPFNVFDALNNEANENEGIATRSRIHSWIINDFQGDEYMSKVFEGMIDAPNGRLTDEGRKLANEMYQREEGVWWA